MWDWIEGGEIGLRVSESANSWMNRFFAFGIRKIQDECNMASSAYCKEWILRPPTDFMIEHGMNDITYGTGFKEMELSFELFEPDTIHGMVVDSYFLGNERTEQRRDISQTI